MLEGRFGYPTGCVGTAHFCYDGAVLSAAPVGLLRSCSGVLPLASHPSAQLCVETCIQAIGNACQRHKGLKSWLNSSRASLPARPPCRDAVARA